MKYTVMVAERHSGEKLVKERLQYWESKASVAHVEVLFQVLIEELSSNEIWCVLRLGFFFWSSFSCLPL